MYVFYHDHYHRYPTTIFIDHDHIEGGFKCASATKHHQLYHPEFSRHRVISITTTSHESEKQS